MTFAEQLLMDCLIAQGVDPMTAAIAVRVVLGAALAADIIQVTRLDAWERDARIYELRGQRVPIAALIARFGLARSNVHVAIRRQGKRRRLALKAAC